MVSIDWSCSMGLKCELLGHDYEISEREPSQTFKVPRISDDSNEYIKRTTKPIHYECTRCGSKDMEVIVDQELVVDDWKSDQDTNKDERIDKERNESYQAHQEAKEREPPVELGDIVDGGVTEIKHHYSGRTDAVIRVNSFVIFVNDVPDSVEKGDILQAKVTSFAANNNFADAVLQDVLE